MTALGGAALRRARGDLSSRAAIVVGLFVASSVLLLVLGADAPGVAFLPLVVPLGALLFFAVPLRLLVFSVATFALVVDPPAGRPAAGLWQSPLYGPGRLLYDNLNTLTGIASLRFSLLEVLIVALCSRALLGRWVRGRAEEAGIHGSAGALTLSLGAWLATMLWLEAFGLARGGDLRNSLWQVRQLFWFPALGWLFSTVISGPRDFRWIARAIIVAAVVKVALGLYFLVAIARPAGLDPAYVMTHDDSYLLVAAVFICLVAWRYHPSTGHLLLLLTVVPWTLLGIAINDRRIAYVSLCGCLMLLYVYLDRRRKRLALLTALLLAPLLAAYLVVGQHRGGRPFAPARKIMSVLMQRDASSSTRDIENYNLYVTLRAKGRLLGSGFGHEYVESVAAYDISHEFSQYRYIAHNSVLWLWSIGGVLGITMLFAALVVLVYFAARCLRLARSALEQTAALVAIGVVLTYLVQSWGDMGTQSWLGVLLLAAMFATVSAIARSTGAWPSGAPLVRWRTQGLTSAPVTGAGT